MKFCAQCGKQLADSAAFCSSCGLTCKTENKSNDSKKKIAIICGVIVIIAVIIVLSIVLSGEDVSIEDKTKIELPCNWGLYEGDVEKKLDAEATNGKMIIYDEKHKVDRIKEFEIYGDKVEYYFYDCELNEISYEFETEDMSYEEMVKVVAEYYGEDFYRQKENTTYWWRDGTVLCLQYGSICYMWDDYYMWTHQDNDVRDYFNK